MARLAIAIPTPVEIEAVIEDIRAERNPYFAWIKRDCDGNWEGLYHWVEAVDPENVLREPCCGDRTYAEAAATAWVSQFAWPHDDYVSLDDDELTRVPRRVPPGWCFDAWHQYLH
jgi:hypothetical protein